MDTLVVGTRKVTIARKVRVTHNHLVLAIKGVSGLLREPIPVLALPAGVYVKHWTKEGSKYSALSFPSKIGPLGSLALPSQPNNHEWLRTVRNTYFGRVLLLSAGVLYLVSMLGLRKEGFQLACFSDLSISDCSKAAQLFLDAVSF